MHHSQDGGEVVFQWGRDRVFDHACCLLLYEQCVTSPLATVDSVTGSPCSRSRPKGLTTTELQKIMSRKYHLSPASTLEVAEKLYNQG